jgi:hypothetical protein
MRQIIQKFVLEPWVDLAFVPKGAQVLSVGPEGNNIVAWLLCDPEAPKVSHVIASHETDVEVPYELLQARFVGTVQLKDHEGNDLAVHIFDGGEFQQEIDSKLGIRDY